MKQTVKRVLQNLVGFERYLRLFSIYKIMTLHWDGNEGDFLHFAHLLPKEGVVLDIGANIGIMSVILGKNHPQSEIYAFEPIPVNGRVLKQIAKFFKVNNISLFQTALGAKNGESTMVMPVMNHVPMHGLAYIDSDIYPKISGQYFQVPMMRLDDFAEINFPKKKITGIKLDVENYEFEVLLGAKNILEKHKPLIYCELWDNENRINTIDYLEKLGYKTAVLSDDKLVPYEKGNYQGQNFFFCDNIPNNKRMHS